jgi:hypothetical protein
VKCMEFNEKTCRIVTQLPSHSIQVLAKYVVGCCFQRPNNGLKAKFHLSPEPSETVRTTSREVGRHDVVVPASRAAAEHASFYGRSKAPAMPRLLVVCCLCASTQASGAHYAMVGQLQFSNRSCPVEQAQVPVCSHPLTCIQAPW